MKAKFRERTEQQKNGELGLIIDEFGRAMWSANREYIAAKPQCGHEDVRFTLSMELAWNRYVDFCMRNPK